jgi:hypothetical protein
MKNCGLPRSLALTACLLLHPIAAICSPGPNSHDNLVFAPSPYFDPGDNAGAIGRTYTVFKTTTRSRLSNGQRFRNGVSDVPFWSVMGNFGGTSILFY